MTDPKLIEMLFAEFVKARDSYIALRREHRLVTLAVRYHEQYAGFIQDFLTREDAGRE